MTMNAPVGPPMATFVPPRAEIINPAMTAVKIPACGGAPEAMANAIASGRATRPTVKPAIKSAMKSWPEYFFKASRSFGRNGIAMLILKQIVAPSLTYLWPKGRPDAIGAAALQFDLLKHSENLKNIFGCM